MPYEGANFWKDWEKEAYADFFEEGKDGFSIPCGIKIFGQFSRGEDKKSFQLKFRDLYGEANLQYRVFDDLEDISEYNALVLRSGSQDSRYAMVRDEFLTSLAKDGSEYLYVQAYKPCVLYINGEYFGVYFLREKVSEDYVSQHLNVSPQTTTPVSSTHLDVYKRQNHTMRQILKKL